MTLKEQLPDLLKNILKHDEEVLSIFQNTISKNVNFLVTDSRVINCQRKNNIESYSYAKIFNITIDNYQEDGPFIFLHRQPVQSSFSLAPDTIMLKNISNIREAKQLIQQAWFPKSPYVARIRAFEQVAQKYDLTLKPVELNGNRNIIMHGIVNEMNMTLSLYNIFKLQQLHITFLCPNSENNFLSIVPEKIGDGISKLFGKQDIITKDKPFDKQFLLQSDHQRFFDFVMTPEIRKNLYTLSRFIDANIIFGTKKEKDKKKKKNKATEFDILDEHLLDELLPVVEHDDHLFSKLSFQANDLRDKLTNIDIILAYSIRYFEVVLKMATRIKEYQK